MISMVIENKVNAKRNQLKLALLAPVLKKKNTGNTAEIKAPRIAISLICCGFINIQSS
jgi:hypothetical protein